MNMRNMMAKCQLKFQLIYTGKIAYTQPAGPADYSKSEGRLATRGLDNRE